MSLILAVPSGVVSKRPKLRVHSTQATRGYSRYQVWVQILVESTLMVDDVRQAVVAGATAVDKHYVDDAPCAVVTSVAVVGAQLKS